MEKGEKSGDCGRAGGRAGGQGIGSERSALALRCLSAYSLPPENDVKAKQGQQSNAKIDILVTWLLVLLILLVK